MRIALLSSTAPPGNAIGNQLAEKLAFFRERGAEVRVFLQSSCNAHESLRPFLGDDSRFLHGVDLLIADYAEWYDLLEILPTLANGKPRIVLDYHGVTPPALWPDDHQRAGIERAARRRGIVWCADWALVHSESSRRELIDATAFPDERILSLGYPIEVDRFAAGKERLRQRWPNAKVILFVGRVAPNKDMPVLIQALACLDDSLAHAVIVGDSSDVYQAEVERCKALACDLGVEERVHFLGQIADDALVDAYRSADVFVMPSRHEGFCLPVIEAMAAGVPVIAARGTALPETVGDAGLTFAVGDAEDLARRLRRVLRSAAPDGAKVNSQGRKPLDKSRPVPEPRTGESTDPTHGTVAPPGLISAEARHPWGLRPRLLTPAPPEFSGSAEILGEKRVAIVCFRFGTDFVGGAEASLRKMAVALRQAGNHVEIFTTCTRSEDRWRNQLPAGTTSEEGLIVHRYPIDPHDRDNHLKTVRAILDANGDVTPDLEAEYLRHSIHSSALLGRLHERGDEFDAVITGPYLFGLTCDVAREFAQKCLVVPCFHDEPLARLKAWPRVYGAAAGILYHSAEEQRYAQSVLGVNHPNSVAIGTFLPVAVAASLATSAAGADRSGTRQSSVCYILYCGRFSAEKNLPLLFDYARRYSIARKVRFVFAGQGNLRIPGEAWAEDAGFVSEEKKTALIAGAMALVQLSTQESLSLSVLEAWAQGVPVIVHRRCQVLAGHVARCGGGVCVACYVEFEAALNDLAFDPDKWRHMGEQGRAYVRAQYGSQQEFAGRMMRAIDNLRIPLPELMHRTGRARAAEFSRETWQESFGSVIDDVLQNEPRQRRFAATVTVQRDRLVAGKKNRTILTPVRITNMGTTALLPRGPARTVVSCTVLDDRQTPLHVAKVALPEMLAPGQARAMMLSIPVPAAESKYTVRIGVHQIDSDTDEAQSVCSLEVGGNTQAQSQSLDGVRTALAEANELAGLPDDYLDVTEGALASLKRRIKAKLLGNFKAAYVDVLSRQQSRVNAQLVGAVHHLAECFETLEHAVQQMQVRLDRLEERLKRGKKEKNHLPG